MEFLKMQKIDKLTDEILNGNISLNDIETELKEDVKEHLNYIQFNY